ncbi:MAG: diphosphate--fructose-6-phosphate 1-phosphotransferase [Abditibacteriota bacterium]|nr:diphosphate--fructose-6-phosphate 1-phosphotransferase [Abditibacteriota bacterium]MBP5092714.1 diphosphate--fructose-6-phosphate 1-phosphotransferase [Abditibacteriota bacterium]
MSKEISPLQKLRYEYKPKLPKALRGTNVSVSFGAAGTPDGDGEKIKELFPNTFGQKLVTITEGGDAVPNSPIKVGVVLSGGQAPGGHNVIAGLYDALKNANPANKLYGFLKGPAGIMKGNYVELDDEIIDSHRNTGGFSMIMSGRDKITTDEDLSNCKKNFDALDLDGCVIIGGDDSNTNAAVLAEYLRAVGSKTCIIGVPKTIDGDMKNEYIETSFGFDTACKTYSELIGNICRDATSAVKYWHFVRLMGRAASHVTLECGFQTHPNITLVSEEVSAKNTTLGEIVDYIVDVIVKRAEQGKNYGVLLVPEGLPEFISDIKTTIDEISAILGDKEKELAAMSETAEKIAFVSGLLSEGGKKVYASLPASAQQVLLTRDSHGNVPLSQVETERLLIDLVGNKIKQLKAQGKTNAKFAAQNHFFGYEGRCAMPTNFDADYCYSLGAAAAVLVRAGLTGYTVNVLNMTKDSDEWVAGGVPVTMMLCIETRKGKDTPVIKKALVDLEGKPFKYFAANRDEWALNDCYTFPGAIQYYGPSEVCDITSKTLALEKN